MEEEGRPLPKTVAKTTILDVRVVRQRGQGHRLVAAHRQSVSLTRLSRLALEVHVLTLLLRSVLSGSVGLHTVQEVVTALRVTDVLNTEVDTLLNLAVADGLVHNHTD